MALIVRQATLKDIKSTVQDLINKEEWNIGRYEVDFFYEVDNTGFYIGELNGVPVSCIAVIKYGPNFAFMGHYIVAKEYRGLGIGLKTYQTAMESLDAMGDYTCGLYCDPEMIPMYQRSGFTVTASTIYNCETTPSIALPGLHSIMPDTSPDIIIKSVYDVTFEDISKYDDFVFGAPHDKYLKGLLSTPETYGFVAINNKQQPDEKCIVVGFIVAQKASLNDGWVIAPLFANSSDIAKCLLNDMLSLLMTKTPNEEVQFCVEVGLNPHCKEIIDSLSVRILSNYVGMYKYADNVSNIEAKTEFVYAVTCPDLG